MITIIIIPLIIIAYLLGSIPTAVWWGRHFYDIDIREHGSGNAGATNTFRVLGNKDGAMVLGIDLLKGWLATSQAWLLYYRDMLTAESLLIWQLILGIAAVSGHIYPLFAGFRGGKGVATLLGMVLSIHYQAALLCVVVFIVVFVVSRYVSLGSMISALAFPLLLLFVPKFREDTPLLVYFGFAVFVLIVYTHKKNIRRLINGEENRANLKLKRRA